MGKLNAARGETGYPAIQLMTLVETGTQALIGASFGTPADGEITWARRLLGHLDQDMLVLMDRGFDGAGFLTDLADTGAQFRVNTHPVYVGEVQGAGKLALQRRPAVRDGVALEEPRLGLDLITGPADLDR